MAINVNTENSMKFSKPKTLIYFPRGWFFTWKELFNLQKIFVLSRILKTFLSLLQGMGKRNSYKEMHELDEKTSFIKQSHQDNTLPNFEGMNVLLM